MDGKAWGLSLRDFRQLSPHDQVLLLVPEGELDADTAASTAQRAAKLISATLPAQQRYQLLVSLVEEDGSKHLAWAVHLFERLRLQKQVGDFCCIDVQWHDSTYKAQLSSPREWHPA